VNRSVAEAPALLAMWMVPVKVVCAGTAGHPAVDVDALLTVR
jgi:hypothetical protein